MKTTQNLISWLFWWWTIEFWALKIFFEIFEATLALLNSHNFYVVNPYNRTLHYQIFKATHKSTFTVQSAGAVEYIDKDPPNECPGYDTKQSDGEDPLIPKLWGIRSTTSLLLIPGQLWLGVVLFTNPSAWARYDTRSIFLSGV